ncbi:MAG: ABC transporter ATP-binding protein [Synergistales bacterium]|nr:ABC transporter ATP-binding protein [Synergistales bacterium]
MILTVNGVSFRYNSRKVLDSIDFRLRKNELLVILGPNGVGKTTLLKCLNAILRPTAGSILVEDRDIMGMDQMEIARDLAYVAQQSQSGRLTAFDAILLGRRPHINWRVRREDICKVESIIRTLHLEDLALRSLDEMSGGEIQKVNIARALVQEPRVLLFDEPTSSLDLKNQVEVMEILDHIVKGHGLAAVITMHDLNTAFRFGHRFLFMKGGRIAYALDREDVTASVIEDVYGIRVELVFVGDIPVVVPSDSHGSPVRCEDFPSRNMDGTRSAPLKAWP